MFDYISVIMFVVLGIGLLTGFIRGGFRTLAGIVVVAAAVLMAVFVSKVLAEPFIKGGMGQGLNSTFYNFLAGKIDIEVAGGLYHVTGTTKITAAELDAINLAGKVYTGDANFDLFHLAYQNISLPQAFYGIVDEVINNAIAAYNGQPFAVAQPLADILTTAACYAVSFIILFVGTCLVGGLIVFLIQIAMKTAGTKPSLLSRIIGAVGGLAIAAGFIWAACLTLNVIMMMDNAVALHIKSVIKIDDPNAWTFAKWLCQANLGYNQIISYIIK